MSLSWTIPVQPQLARFLESNVTGTQYAVLKAPTRCQPCLQLFHIVLPMKKISLLQHHARCKQLNNILQLSGQLNLSTLVCPTQNPSSKTFSVLPINLDTDLWIVRIASHQIKHCNLFVLILKSWIQNHETAARLGFFQSSSDNCSSNWSLACILHRKRPGPQGPDST